jgi:hypothetical protein
MAFDWNTFNSNRSGRGGWSDWGLDTSTSFPGSDTFGGLDDWFDPYTDFDVSDSPLNVEVLGAIPSVDLYTSLFEDSDWLTSGLKDEGRISSQGFKLSPAAEAILFENLPYITDTFYGPDRVIPGQLGGFNPDVGPIGLNFEQTPGTFLDYYGFGAGDFMPDYFTDDEPFGGVHSTTGDELGPSGREKINTTPGMGSTANTGPQVQGQAGTPSGPSVREPSTTTTDTEDDGTTDPRDPTSPPFQLPDLGGLTKAALGLALLREFLGLFNRDEATYQGVDLPELSDIPVPVTPRIAPARVVSYEEYAPRSRPSTPVNIEPIEGLGRAKGGLASAVKPYLLAQGGRLDFRHGAPVVGEGTGQSDDIPALLSDGEYVIDADTVAALGDGSNKAGAKVLDEFRKQIREHKRSAATDKIPPKAKKPLAYLKEAKKNG